MKYIVVGLGSFGASLAAKLTEAGNEVIGIDTNMDRVDHYKEHISHTICMDATDEFTVAGLPLKDTDMVVVAIGEDKGASVMATALFKNLQVKRLISRSIDQLHEKVLHAIGVDEIVHPEEESAERWAKKLCLKGVVDSFELNDDFSIVEVSVPVKLHGKTIKDSNIREQYNLLVLTTIANTQERTIVGKVKFVTEVKGVANPNSVLNKDDLIVVYGANKDIKKFLKD
ncbi:MULTISPECIES: potassium channel family protein [Flagellimonas]|uniref:TrkA family potassium uptake protein n=2 Tax=Flagellimonas TaxID=444459 RepID=A0A3A1NFC4_9FLAO|nr:MULTISPECIES: TrkA family potassium uptake protein [Allomuricauda]RIV43420.1 TrkA family potassium uptake protein [Allomuricauda maritima]RIV71319.1 TrkA family potassium uptake protein [Allomuricauda aequoris]TXJ92757.1 TrkA family potassium uptake protein [Allomuricauda maritima]TXK02788.1 TrkA family potassium uptake protein [Allomuricauda aequoris]